IWFATANERQLVHTQAQRDAFAQAVFDQIQVYYVGLLSDGVEFAPGDGSAAGDRPGFHLSWTNAGTRGVLREAVNGDRLFNALGGFIAGPSYNEPQGQYVLSQILSQNARTGQTVNVYLNSIFKSPYNIDFDAPADQLEGLSAIVAAHELGHALGL